MKMKNFKRLHKRNSVYGYLIFLISVRTHIFKLFDFRTKFFNINRKKNIITGKNKHSLQIQKKILTYNITSCYVIKL